MYVKVYIFKVRYLNYLDFMVDYMFFDNIVYFVDGWFGLWNDNLCERFLVEENFKFIFKEKSNEKNIKFVVGLRFEVKYLY